MSTWQQTPTGFIPDQDPNKQYYGAPPPGGYPGAGYPGGQQPSYPPYPPGPGQPAAPPYGGFVAPPPVVPPYGQMPPPQPPLSMYGGGGGPEGGIQSGSYSFSDENIRRNFIKKVYSLLMCQLAVTSAVIAIFSYHEPTRKYVAHNMALTWSALGIVLVCIICMACCGDVRRKSPLNFIFLGIFTLAESVMLGCAAASFQKEEVLMAAGATAIVCFALTMFAFQTKWDFTGCGAGLFVAVILLMVFGIFCIIFPNKIASIAYASIGALLFSLYLIYDTQLMMGGKHKYSISPEEYIFATLNLYLDIINIFLYILTIIGLARD